MTLQKVCGGKLVDKWSGEGIPIIVGNQYGAEDVQIKCKQEKRPYVYIDHGYFTRGYENGVFRFCVGHFHTRDWRTSDRPYPKPNPYHGGENVIILPPASMVEYIHKAQWWLKETVSRLSELTDRKIIIKHKGDGKLADFLENAHAIVSFGSHGEVESLLHGVPVFTTMGPSSRIADKLDRIETPTLPDRGEWLSALAGAEYGLWELDKAWGRLLPLLEDWNESQHIL